MNQDNISDCITYIITNTIKEMTDTQKLILSIGYPMSNDDEMIESIKNKAKFVVLNYVINQNTPKEQGEALKNINTF